MRYFAKTAKVKLTIANRKLEVPISEKDQVRILKDTIKDMDESNSGASHISTTTGSGAYPLKSKEKK